MGVYAVGVVDRAVPLREHAPTRRSPTRPTRGPAPGPPRGSRATTAAPRGVAAPCRTLLGRCRTSPPAGTRSRGEEEIAPVRRDPRHGPPATPLVRDELVERRLRYADERNVA